MIITFTRVEVQPRSVQNTQEFEVSLTWSDITTGLLWIMLANAGKLALIIAGYGVC